LLFVAILSDNKHPAPIATGRWNEI